MFLDLEAVDEGEWFPFFGSHIDQQTGEVVYEDPEPDAKVRVRSLAPFFEERIANRKRCFEHVLNSKHKVMERIPYYPDLSPAEAKKERDDTWDYAITGFEGFKDKKTGKLIECTRENKVKLMRVPVFDRFVARCLQLLNGAAAKDEQDLEKNS